MCLAMLASCATGKKSTGGDSLVDDNFDDGGDDVRRQGDSFVHSLSQNSLTSKTINKSSVAKVARSLANSLKGSDQSVKGKLESLIAAERLSGKSLNSILNRVRKLSELELKRGVDREIADEVKLEVGVAALQSKNYAMMDFMLLPLKKSKKAIVRAGALNALGVMHLKEGRVPEAVQLFHEALKSKSDFEAAQLNLGFIALKNGDQATAKKMFNRVPRDWFSDYGLLIAARQTNDLAEVDSLCESILKKRSHKPTLFSCGLYEWYAKKNASKAKKLIEKAASMSGGDPKWSEQGYRVLGEIQAR